MTALPFFSLYPEPLLGFIGETLGGPRDIDFPDHPRFSERYAMNSHDEQRSRFICNPNVLSFFESRPTIYVDGGAGFLFVYIEDKIILSEYVST